MHLESAPGTTTVVADGYRLQVRRRQAEAVLAGADGRIWSRLCLLAGVDRTDCADESYALGELEVVPAPDEDAVDVLLRAGSTAWSQKSVRLRCFADRLELTVHVAGHGELADVRLLGGRAVLASGACGTFRSSAEFASVFVPTPTEPVAVVRPAAAAATLGVVGDAAAGRLHGIFSPPPLCLALGRAAAPAGATEVPDGEWLALGVVARPAELTCTELRYAPLDGGFLVELDYDGQTTVAGEFTSPPLVLQPARTPWQALADHRDRLVASGSAPEGTPAQPAGWWSEPLFCGWGAQCAEAPALHPAGHSYFLDDLPPGALPDGTAVAPALARQDRYDRWLERLEAHGVRPGTIVIDDRWQAAYGTCEPDPEKWPDLRAWIAARHARGQRVLLWFKAWDAEGLPADECVTDPAGTPVCADPGSPAYRERLARVVAGLLGPDGLDADGFKIDFTQRGPAGRGLRRPGAELGAPWGIAALHLLLSTIYRAAKAAKPDALVVTHTPHPGFADVTDMIRLNDVLERDTAAAIVPAAEQLAFRHAVATAALPHHLIDTDQWPLLDRAQWRDYVAAQAGLGVPALYYAERIDGSREPITEADLEFVAASWEAYRAQRSAVR